MCSQNISENIFKYSVCDKTLPEIILIHISPAINAIVVFLVWSPKELQFQFPLTYDHRMKCFREAEGRNKALKEMWITPPIGGFHTWVVCRKRYSRDMYNILKRDTRVIRNTVVVSYWV